VTENAYDVAGTGLAALDRVVAGQRTTTYELGGSCGNVLISLAMLGRSVVPLLRLGDDRVGERLIEEFSDAGVDVRHIIRERGVRSPMIEQRLDEESAQHCFQFFAHENQTLIPEFVPIDRQAVEQAESVIRSSQFFYTDRLSLVIVEAMEMACDSGAFVYFEPSRVDDADLFARALRATSILKYSSDRIRNLVNASELRPGTIRIATHGSNGLEIFQDHHAVHKEAINLDEVRDTCGAGDMVTVGIIDWVLSKYTSAAAHLDIADFAQGVEAGQRLAAANCAYIGARGLFRDRGADVARRLLDNLPYERKYQPSFWEEQPTE